MRFSSILSISALVAAGRVAAGAHEYAVHEKRHILPSKWEKRSKVDGGFTIPMGIALAQRNLHLANEYLMEVSDPKSAKFGQHWSPKQVADTFAPNLDSILGVKEWLTDSGVDVDRVTVSESRGWLKFDATIEEAERLLQTEYYTYEHDNSGKIHVACESYSVPKSVQPHIDFITPTVHFDTKVGHRPRSAATDDDKLQKRKEHRKAAVGRIIPDDFKATGVGAPGNGFLPKLGKTLSKEVVQASAAGVATCDEAITPDCLRALYGIPATAAAVPGSTYGIVEYTPQAYLPADLDAFFRMFAPTLVGKRPTLDSVDGGQLQTIVEDFSFNGESDLDLEYAMALVAPNPVTLYQVGDLTEGASFNNFLDALDSSFCAGDDPTFDAAYPDPFGGFQGKTCGEFTAAKVISTSYGYNEADLTPAYEIRQCNEYMKLGLQGVTVLYSSGDSGVAGNGAECIDLATGQYNDGSSGFFNPGFPGGCPFITSVGATQMEIGSTVTDPETAAKFVIFSGGGFSNVFSLPDYQAGALETYFTEHAPPYTSAQFNNSGSARGFPDIAANGVNITVAVDGEFGLVFGTSASSPFVGGIIQQINGERLTAGKSTVGFLNPTLYQNPDVLNDITTGDNPGCGTDGFSAVEGWDPVTGLGTPNYPKLLELYLSLP